MWQIFENEFTRIDIELGSAPLEELPALLRRIPLEEFGRLLFDVPAKYPNMRAALPSMASPEVQNNWTGWDGEGLLAQSIAFVRTMIAGYTAVSGRRIEEATILDFGCGWGRILRLLAKVAPAKNIYAVDAWDESIRLCRQHRVPGQIALSEWVPRSLPFDRTFDLIFAFSVFTHLSERTCQIALSTLRRHIADGGALVITIRPKEYWHHHDQGRMAQAMIEAHDTDGFAFVPHNRPPIDGDITYGDASISIEYIEKHFPQWRVHSVEWNQLDPFQILVFMQPVWLPAALQP